MSGIFLEMGLGEKRWKLSTTLSYRVLLFLRLRCSVQRPSKKVTSYGAVCSAHFNKQKQQEHKKYYQAKSEKLITYRTDRRYFLFALLL